MKINMKLKMKIHLKYHRKFKIIQTMMIQVMVAINVLFVLRHVRVVLNMPAKHHRLIYFASLQPAYVGFSDNATAAPAQAPHLLCKNDKCALQVRILHAEYQEVEEARTIQR